MAEEVRKVPGPARESTRMQSVASATSAPEPSAPASGGSPSQAAATTSAAPTTSNLQSAAVLAGRAYGVNETGSRILITAKGNSWIQVRDDAANEMLLTRLLRAGDSYRVPNRSGLKLVTGDPGALEILVDGQQVPAVGTSGNVRRNIVLDADRLRAGTAAAD